jgi:hypothetical protein
LVEDITLLDCECCADNPRLPIKLVLVWLVVDDRDLVHTLFQTSKPSRSHLYIVHRSMEWSALSE